MWHSTALQQLSRVAVFIKRAFNIPYVVLTKPKLTFRPRNDSNFVRHILYCRYGISQRLLSFCVLYEEEEVPYATAAAHGKLKTYGVVGSPESATKVYMSCFFCLFGQKYATAMPVSI